ncbi:MAG: MFS transporter, partial [Planctomycetota bacterium]|nr:MFS transporter [Planctomycetota bacterium]
MIALSEHRLLRLVVLCALYTAQGIPFGFRTITLATYLAGEGLDSAAIGAIGMAATIPWGFKWVWGPFVDRFGSTRFGRRRPWILAAQTGMIGT